MSAGDGKKLFRELFRHFPTAKVEDYYRNGQWDVEALVVDTELVIAHRREAGAREAPPVDESKMPELPGDSKAAQKPALPPAPRAPPPTSAAKPAKPQSRTPTAPRQPPSAAAVAQYRDNELKEMRASNGSRGRIGSDQTREPLAYKRSSSNIERRPSGEPAAYKRNFSAVERRPPGAGDRSSAPIPRPVVGVRTVGSAVRRGSEAPTSSTKRSRSPPAASSSSLADRKRPTAAAPPPASRGDRDAWQSPPRQPKPSAAVGAGRPGDLIASLLGGL